jgi:hypothetical protein
MPSPILPAFRFIKRKGRFHTVILLTVKFRSSHPDRGLGQGSGSFQANRPCFVCLRLRLLSIGI